MPWGDGFTQRRHCFADMALRSRRAIRPSRWINFPSKREGAGNAGCALHPRSRVQDCAKNAHTSIQVQRRQSDIPCAMALRLMPCSPRRRIRLVTVAAGLMAIPTRSDRISHRQLDTSNGCRNHTVLPYAAASFVWCALIAHGNRPATTLARPTLPRPPHPIPTFVTTADAPRAG